MADVSLNGTSLKRVKIYTDKETKRQKDRRRSEGRLTEGLTDRQFDKETVGQVDIWAHE
jgi:hypothetical protein